MIGAVRKELSNHGQVSCLLIPSYYFFSLFGLPYFFSYKTVFPSFKTPSPSQDTATIRSIELLARLGIEDLDLILKERRLRWYGHVERSNGAVKTAFDIQVNGKRGPGRPKLTWKQLTERDRREWKLSAIDPRDRDTWRSGVRSAMRAASQLPGRGPTVVDMAPIPAH